MSRFLKVTEETTKIGRLSGAGDNRRRLTSCDPSETLKSVDLPIENGWIDYENDAEVLDEFTLVLLYAS